MRDESRTTRRSRLARWATVGLVALALPLAACDDEDEDGNGTGPDQATASVEMTDSEDGSAAIGASQARLATASGTFTADAEATLIAQGGTEVDLGDPVAVTVNLQTGQSVAVFTNVDVDAGAYTGARVTLSGAQAVVDSGSTLNLAAGPLELTAETTITVEGEEDVVIEGSFAAPVEVSGGGSMTAVVDLNSATWLDEAVVTAGATEGTVAASEIEAAATVTAEGGGT